MEDKLLKPIKVKFWAPVRGLWIEAILTYNRKEPVFPFVMTFVGKRTKPYAQTIPSLDEPRVYSSLSQAMEGMSNYIQIWATE